VNLKTLANDIRLQVGFTLFLVWFLDIWHFRSDPHILQIIVYPLLAILLVAIFDLCLTFLRYRKTYLPTAVVVSGFLIGLIISPSEPVWVILTAGVLVTLSKQFLAKGIRQHIFNPAALGIMGVYLIFGTTVAWWGVSWSWYPLAILVPLMIRILWRLHRLYLPLGFLLVYFIYLILTSSADLALGTLVDPTVLLFALVMLPEPITSPIAGYFKYLFGAGVAIIAILMSTFLKIGDVFLPSLLLSNLASFLIIRLMAKTKKVQ